MGEPALKLRDIDLEVDGSLRMTVFPNNVRDTRRARGFHDLRPFVFDQIKDTHREWSDRSAKEWAKIASDEKRHLGVVQTIYARLSRIERGELIPTDREMKLIARELGVGVDDLLLDHTDPGFDRREWAREHVAAKFSERGGDEQAMIMGAAIRYRRRELGLPTTSLGEFKITAATASRLENAERPVSRWSQQIQRRVAKLFGKSSMKAVKARVSELLEAGELDPILQELFGRDTIERAANEKLLHLYGDLPGKKAKKLYYRIADRQSELREKMEPANENEEPESELDQLEPEPEPKPEVPAPRLVGGTDTISVPVLGRLIDGLRSELTETGNEVLLPASLGMDLIALRLQKPVLGHALPAGTVLIADRSGNREPKNLVLVVNEEEGVAFPASIDKGIGNEEDVLTSRAIREPIPLSSLGESEKLCPVVHVSLALDN